MTFQEFTEKMGLEILPNSSELDALIESKNYYPYDKGTKPEGFSFTWKAYGDINKNRLYLEMIFNNGDRKIGRINSGLAWPAMIDRMFGMDKMDSDYLNILSDVMMLMFVDEPKKTFEEAVNYKENNQSK